MLKTLTYSLIGIILMKLFWFLTSIIATSAIGTIVLCIMFVIVPGYVVGAMLQERS